LKNKQFIFYAIFGLSSVILDYLVFKILITFFKFTFINANIISVNVGIINSFLLNYKLNFKTTNNLFLRFISFYTIGLSGLLLSSLLLFYLIEILQIEVIISKFITIIIVSFFQFIFNLTITFKKIK